MGGGFTLYGGHSPPPPLSSPSLRKDTGLTILSPVYDEWSLAGPVPPHPPLRLFCGKCACVCVRVWVLVRGKTMNEKKSGGPGRFQRGKVGSAGLFLLPWLQ